MMVGWIDHLKNDPTKPMLFTENEGWFQAWGNGNAIRTPSDLAYSVAEWFAGGGSYHAYYMWHGGNNYGRTAGSGITTMYADDVCLHSDGTPNEPKYTQLSRLQHIIANHAQDILKQDPNRTPLPHWDGQKWVNSSQQYVFAYPPSIYFLGNQVSGPVNVLYRDQNITMHSKSVRIYDDNLNLLWDSANYSDINSDNTKLFPVVTGPLEWKIWSEPTVSNLPVITSPNPIEQLTITNDETIYLWYRRNVTLPQTQSNTRVTVETRKSNALLFFLNGQYLGEFDNHDHTHGSVTATVSVDLSTFKSNQQYLFEILSISLGLDNSVGTSIGNFEYKGIVGKYGLKIKY